MLPAARQVQPDRLRAPLALGLVLAVLGLVAGSFSPRWLSSDDVVHTRIGLRTVETCSDQWWGLPGDPTPRCEEPTAIPLTSANLPWSCAALGRITFALGLAAALLLAVLAGRVATRRTVRRELVLGAVLATLAALGGAYAFVLLAPWASLGLARGSVVFFGGALLGAPLALLARDRERATRRAATATAPRARA